MTDLREQAARAIKDRVERDGFATHEELADAAIAAGVGAVPAVLWRVGSHYGIHVYAGDVPVATFHRAEDALRAVVAVNGDTPPAPPETGEAET